MSSRVNTALDLNRPLFENAYGNKYSCMVAYIRQSESTNSAE